MEFFLYNIDEIKNIRKWNSSEEAAGTFIIYLFTGPRRPTDGSSVHQEELMNI